MEKTVVIVGCGALGKMIARGIASGQAGNYRLAGLFDTDPDRCLAVSRELACCCFATISSLLEAKPDFLVEAANINALRSFGPQVLASGISLIPLSLGALAEKDFYQELQQAALQAESRVYLPSGAIGGLDLLGAAAVGKLHRVHLTTEKPPRAFAGAPALQGRTLSKSTTACLFEGNAQEAIAAFPKNVNVSVALGLACGGLEQMQVTVISDPRRKDNQHTLSVEGDFGTASLQICARPSENAGSSKLAAYSVIHLLQKLAAPICFA